MPKQKQRSGEANHSSRDSQALSVGSALSRHWPEYLIEAWGLGMFMISASMFTCLMEASASPLPHLIANPAYRRGLIGLAMGLTAIGLIYSPWGRRSGAHFNPAVTLAFLTLGKIRLVDAGFYMVAHFFGGTLGMGLALSLIGPALAEPRVNFIATLPGAAGINTAFAAEFGIAMGLMVSVLQGMRLAKLSRYTGLIAGSLVALFITFEAPLSGMSMNPARSFASAVTGHTWQHFWLYCTAPVLGMQTAALCFLPLRRYVKCAKLIHRSKHRCIHCGQK